jgi:exosome complex RNA-binding protein Rrp42 (RNase PH superfamily)
MLGVEFFNQGDIAKSEYFHGRAMNQLTEDPKVRIIELAKNEIRLKQRKIEQDRIIEVRFESAVDLNGN